MPTIISNMIHARRFPAIYRSFISKSPYGFFRVISLVKNCFGHSKSQIVGSSASFPGSQPPPTHSPDASTQPINLGSPMNNSFSIVGSRAVSFSSGLKSQNVCFAAAIRGFTCRILFINVIKSFPFGTAVAACRIFRISFSIRLNGAPFVMRKILCSSASIKLCLSHSGLMHRVAPSTIQHITSFLTAKWPLHESKFFLDIGFCPLCPDQFGGGKMLWIPCINALEKWSNCAESLVYAMCIKSSQNTSSMVQNGFPSNIVKNLLYSYVPQML